MDEDNSFSGIVNQIQEDKEKARLKIIELSAKVKHHEAEGIKFKELEKKANGRSRGYLEAIKKVFMHMKYEPPIVIIYGGCHIIEIGKDFEITIKKESEL